MSGRPGPVGRGLRAVLVVLLAILVSACGVELQDEAEPLPGGLLPTSSPSPKPSQTEQDTMVYFVAGPALEGVPDGKRDAFIATVRPNVTSPGEVGEWARVVFTADEAVPVVAPEADSALFEAVLDAWEKHGPDLKALAAEAKSATGAKGRAFFHPLRLALTGREHGPELGALLTLIPDEIVRGRLARCRDA
jgi:glutamyl-tRNA synthetase